MKRNEKNWVILILIAFFIGMTAMSTGVINPGNSKPQIEMSAVITDLPADNSSVEKEFKYRKSFSNQENEIMCTLSEVVVHGNVSKGNTQQVKIPEVDSQEDSYMLSQNVVHPVKVKLLDSDNVNRLIVQADIAIRNLTV